MASITRRQTDQAPWYQRLKTALYELEFVTSAFTWLFRLASRIAEPAMTIATIYVIIEAGVPVISQPVLHLLAIAIMISAPEVILPGGFILASEIKVQGNKHYKALYAMCWLFVILTSATLADLFIWHFSGPALATLMWTRCAAAVGYSILFRVITYKREIEVMPIVDVLTRFQEFTDLLTEMQDRAKHQEQQIVQMVHSQVSQVVQSVVQQVVREQGESLLLEVQSVVHSQVSQVVQSHNQEVQQVVQSVVQQLPEIVQFLVGEQVQTVIRMMEDNQSVETLQALGERLQEVSTTVEEMRTTLTIARRSERASKPELPSSVGGSRELAKVVHLPAKIVESEPASELPLNLQGEPVDVRIRWFIQQQSELGRVPSLSEIVNQCKCSKNTAIRYRREVTGEDDSSIESNEKEID